MKKAAAVLAPLVGVAAWGGPFGVDMGQPVEGSGGTSQGVLYDELDPPNGFDSLTVYGTEKTGACKVQIVQMLEDPDAYGQDVRSAMTMIKETLQSKYGDPSDEYDFLRAGSIWDEPKDWFTALRLKERTYAFYWFDVDSSEFAGVKNIGLEAEGDRRLAMVILGYEFANFSECVSVGKEKQKEQF